jgi:pimeloyl-ACP methyl ester carboxylesterase
VSPLLNHVRVTAPGATPDRWMLLLHGMLGSASNWRSFAQRLTGDVPDLGAVGVDLRMHGASQGFPAPHTLDSAAGDLTALEPHLPGPVRAVLGHSFGGKVALAYARARGEALTNLFLVDSNPGVREGGQGSETTLAVLSLLESMPRRFDNREAFIEKVESAGFDRGLAQWLAMNLDRGDKGFSLKHDLGALRCLLEDYLRQDLWPVLEELPSSVRVTLIVGGRSQVMDQGSLERLRVLCARRPRWNVVVLPSAGHWVHVDDPEGVYRSVRDALLAQALPGR